MADLIKRIALAICEPRLKWSEAARKAVPGPCEAVCEECMIGGRAAACVMLEEMQTDIRKSWGNGEPLPLMMALIDEWRTEHDLQEPTGR